MNGLLKASALYSDDLENVFTINLYTYIVVHTNFGNYYRITTHHRASRGKFLC